MNICKQRHVDKRVYTVAHIFVPHSIFSLLGVRLQGWRVGMRGRNEWDWGAWCEIHKGLINSWKKISLHIYIIYLYTYQHQTTQNTTSSTFSSFCSSWSWEGERGKHYDSTNWKSMFWLYFRFSMMAVSLGDFVKTTFWIITFTTFNVTGFCIPHTYWQGHANYVLHNDGVVHIIGFIPG